MLIHELHPFYGFYLLRAPKDITFLDSSIPSATWLFPHTASSGTSSQTVVLLLMSDTSFLHECAETFLYLTVTHGLCQTQAEVQELISQAFCNKPNLTCQPSPPPS